MSKYVDENGNPRKVKVYAAGPDMFYPDFKERRQKVIDACEKYGLEYIGPGKPKSKEEQAAGPDWSKLTKFERGVACLDGNIETLKEADIIIANMDDYRGWEPDAGTVFEAACGFAWEKPVFLYKRDARPLAQRYLGKAKQNENGRFVDEEGRSMEGDSLNLMLIASCDGFVEGGFEEAAKMAAEKLGLL